MRRWFIVMPVVVFVTAALALGGYALAQTSSGSQTTRDRLPTVAAFCQSHASRAGFWSGGGQTSFVQMAINAAPWSHRQFEAVAGTLCTMLHRLATGHTVLVPVPNAPAQARRPIHRPQIVRAIRELERLPDAK